MAATPNYQGMFLRGYGNQYSSHWGTVSHSSGKIGAMQGDSIREIYGLFETTDTGKDNHYGEGATLISATYTTSPPIYSAFTSSGSRTSISAWNYITFYASRSSPVSNEIKPVNIAVRYLVRTR